MTLQNERQRMARELHDTLVQGVAGYILQLEAIKAHLAAQRIERAAAIVEQAILRARTTLAESRAAILTTCVLYLTTSAALSSKRWVSFKQSTGISCELEMAVNAN